MIKLGYVLFMMVELPWADKLGDYFAISYTYHEPHRQTGYPANISINRMDLYICHIFSALFAYVPWIKLE